MIIIMIMIIELVLIIVITKLTCLMIMMIIVIMKSLEVLLELGPGKAPPGPSACMLREKVVVALNDKGTRKQETRRNTGE